MGVDGSIHNSHPFTLHSPDKMLATQYLTCIPGQLMQKFELAQGQSNRDSLTLHIL